MFSGKNILILLLFWHFRINAQNASIQSAPDLPCITFSNKSLTLSKQNKATLDSIIVYSKKFPDYKIVAICFFSCSPKYSKLSYKRLNTVVNYLLKSGIDASKIFTGFTHNVSPELITFRLEVISITDEPPPHPNLNKSKQQ